MFEDERLSVDEGADYLHVHHRTLRDAINRGEIPAARIGRRIILSKSVLRAMLEGKARVGGKASSPTPADPLEAA